MARQPRLIGCSGTFGFTRTFTPTAGRVALFFKVTLKTEGIACYGALGDGNGDASSNVDKVGPRIPALGSLTLALAKINVFLKYSGYGNPKQAACREYFYAPGEPRPGIS